MVAHGCDHRTQEAEVGDSSVQAVRGAPISLIATETKQKWKKSTCTQPFVGYCLSHFWRLDIKRH